MATLRECIDRWHAAHTDFVRIPPVILPWGAGRNWIVTEAGRCQAGAAMESTAPKVRQSLEMRMRRGAALLGISLDEYRQRVEAGLKWCSGHQEWEPRQDFGRATSRADGLTTSCRAHVRTYALAYARQMRGGVRYVRGAS